MNLPKEEPESNRRQYAFNLTLAAVAGQVGCLTTLIVLAALFGGLWLDSHFGTKPMITIGLILISVPITLVAMIWIVRTTTARITSKEEKQSLDFVEEEQLSE
jgi:hypothetical protein